MLTELLCEVVLPRSSYLYHRVQMMVADKYLDARQAMAKSDTLSQ